MLTSITGIYRNGQIILTETPADLPDETQVIVTFLQSTTALDLASRGIDPAQAADLRARLQSIADDWDSSDMDIYNDYDANKTTV